MVDSVAPGASLLRQSRLFCSRSAAAASERSPLRQERHRRVRVVCSAPGVPQLRQSGLLCARSVTAASEPSPLRHECRCCVGIGLAALRRPLLCIGATSPTHTVVSAAFSVHTAPSAARLRNATSDQTFTHRYYVQITASNLTGTWLNNQTDVETESELGTDMEAWPGRGAW